MPTPFFFGIDASRCCHPQPTGVELYSDAIVQGLLQQAQSDGVAVTVYTRNAPACLSLHGAQERRIRFPFLWTQAGLSLEMMRREPTVLFVPSHTLPVQYPRRSVVTIHDVAFIPCQQAYSMQQRAYLAWSTRYTCKHATAIIVPSEATKQDLLEYFSCPREKIHVIPHGFTKPKKSTADDATVLQKLGLVPDKKFILFLGRLEEKKNLVRLLQAFSLFRKDHPGFLLVLAGKPGVGYPAIAQTFRTLLLHNDVLLPGYISLEEKDVLFRHASLFTLPSRYEGFGFPVLDAFYYGVPTVASRHSSLPEITGDAALAVDTNDVDDLARALAQLASDQALRERLIAQGKERLQQFSWEKSVAATWQILQEVAV